MGGGSHNKIEPEQGSPQGVSTLAGMTLKDLDEHSVHSGGQAHGKTPGKAPSQAGSELSRQSSRRSFGLASRRSSIQSSVHLLLTDPNVTAQEQLGHVRDILLNYLKRNTKDALLQLEAACACFYTVIVPYHIAFTEPERTGFVTSYAISYVVDCAAVFCLACRVFLALPSPTRRSLLRYCVRGTSSHDTKPHRQQHRHGPPAALCTIGVLWDISRALLRVLLVVPYDAFFWDRRRSLTAASRARCWYQR